MYCILISCLRSGFLILSHCFRLNGRQIQNPKDKVYIDLISYRDREVLKYSPNIRYRYRRFRYRRFRLKIRQMLESGDIKTKGNEDETKLAFHNILTSVPEKEC